MPSRRLAGSLVALGVLAAACTAGSAAPSPAPPPPPGTLLSSHPGDPAPALKNLDAQITLITYASRSALDNSPIRVTGVVIEPAGRPPAGGWPVVSYAHGTTGLADRCAPSRLPRLGSQLRVVLPLLEAGYLVTATDYEGLGTPGPHPYLYPRSEARGVIDAVRAARQLVPAASDRWVAVGLSQGAQAAWATAELADDWAPELEFLGSVALAPPTDPRELVGEVPDGLSRTEKAFYAAILTSVRLRHPELDVTDYLSGPALELLTVLQQRCLRAAIAATPTTGYAPSSPRALQRLRHWLAGLALPAQPAAAPMFVAVGARDDLVPAGMVSDSVREACALGDVIEYEVYPQAGHPALPAAAEDALRWIAARFSGRPAPSTCYS